MQKLFGGVMIGCGVLIAGLGGLCTLLLTVTAMLEPGSQDASEFAMMIPAMLIAGGIPVGMGVGLYFLGRYLVRQAGAKMETPRDQSDTFR